MTQRSLNFYFNKENDIESSDSESEDLPIVEKTIQHYQQMINKQNDVKECTKIMVKSGTAAECWKYFGHLTISNKTVLEKYNFCSICLESKTILKGFGVSTSTTNYRNHLKAVHDIDVKSTNHQKTSALTKHGLSSTAKNSKFVQGRRLAQMCCLDLEAFKIVERKGFQKYIKSINPEITFPTSTTVATTALNDVFDVYMSAVKEVLSKCPNDINLVLDMWTDRYKKISYINIKIQYCEDFIFKCCSLKTEHFPHPHTGKAIAEKVLETLKFFSLEQKKIRAITDGGSNIVSALKLQNIERFNCIAHTLHRFLMHDILNNDMFDQLNNIISKLKKIFRTLTYRGEDIEKIQQLKENENLYELILNIQNLNNCLDMDDKFSIGYFDAELEEALKPKNMQTLKNSVETRWNSNLKMIQSFIENVDVINIVLLKLKKETLIIPEMEQQIIKEFGDFLSIFSDATTYLQGQEYPTISTCVYFYESIYTNLVQKADVSSFGLIIHLYDYARQHFYKRFKILKIHLVAALLDPCQKNWATLNNYLKKVPNLPYIPDTFVLERDVENPISKERLIIQEIENITFTESPSSSSTCTEPPAKKEKISETRRKMLAFLSESGQCTPRDSIALEVQKYFDATAFDVESLDWWKEHQKVFPRVAEVAKIYFGIPATSASSEIAFSVAGSCITEKRCSLNPVTVKKQLFIHDNHHLVSDVL